MFHIRLIYEYGFLNPQFKCENIIRRAIYNFLDGEVFTRLCIASLSFEYKISLNLLRYLENSWNYVIKIGTPLSCMLKLHGNVGVEDSWNYMTNVRQYPTIMHVKATRKCQCSHLEAHSLSFLWMTVLQSTKLLRYILYISSPDHSPYISKIM